jgi:hypothetical protein
MLDADEMWDAASAADSHAGKRPSEQHPTNQVAMSNI